MGTERKTGRPSSPARATAGSSGNDPRRVTPAAHSDRSSGARKDLDDLAAVRTDEAGHVLDAADDAHAASQHVEHLAAVEVRHVLRADHDQRAAEVDEAEQLLLEIGGAGRQVDHEHVELAPLDVRELPQRTVEQLRRHRASAWSSPIRNPTDISLSP